MADALAPSLNPLFHTNPELASKTVQPASWKESWLRDAKAIVQLIKSGGKADAIAAVASQLPPNDPLGMFITKFMVNTLWSSMLHPPLSYKGPAFQYRSADGSGNSVLFPKLGQAGLPYAKTVQAASATHGAKPDPGDLFDMLMARDESKFNKESDLGVSSMLLYHADLIIHDIFRTNATDKNISDTSSYLDLSSLYGRNRATQEAVRTMKNGLLKPDSFAEDRLLNQPPGVCIYLIMYSRFHNYVAHQLKAINENGKFTQNPPMPENWVPTTELFERIQKDNQLFDEIENHNDELAAMNDKITKDNQNALDGASDKAEFKQRPNLKQQYEQPLYYRANVRDKITELPSLDVFAKNQEAWCKKPEWLKTMWARQCEIKLDEDLFQTARLITCGLYINIAIHDYLRCLMRKHAEFTSWTLDPRLEMSIFNKDTIQRGIGNQVTVEFNVLYRFHSPLSTRDAGWTKRFLQGSMRKCKIDPDSHQPDAVTQDQFDMGDIPLAAMKKVLAKLVEENSANPNYLAATPRYLRVDKDSEDDSQIAKGRILSFILQRNPHTQKFNDTDLVSEMVRVMQDPICQFGAQNVPKFFRTIEILGILQSRKWEMATLNEFRTFFKMPRHKTFEDINADPAISQNLRNLYGHPDMVELYPGLFCEGQGRCLDPGTSGPGGSGTALWRGVFSDAVTLVRSDRFYTIDWNADSLTGWGMNEVSADNTIFKGGVMHRLFRRAFPGHFKNNSIHMWEPFYTPAMNITVAYEQGQLDDLQSVHDLGLSETDLKKFLDLENHTSLISGKLSTFPRNAKNQIITQQRVEGTVERFLKEKGIDVGSLDDLEDVETTHKELNDAFYSMNLLKRLFKSRDKDAQALIHKIRFKFLKDKVKLPVVERALPPTAVSNPHTLHHEFLNPKKVQLYKNPGYADKTAIPEGPLQDVLTQTSHLYSEGEKIMQHLVTPEWENTFFDYFVDMAATIRKRQQLDFSYYNNGNLGKANQIDVIQDFAVPVVTRFVADFLGFGHLIKTATMHGRAYDERQIYAHFSNCQDYLTFDSDETKAYAKRKAFYTSIRFLLDLTEKGAADSRRRWLEYRRNHHIVDGDSGLTRDVRAFGVLATQELTKQLGSEKKAAAVKLAVALEAIHKSIVMFAVVLQHLLRDNDRQYWGRIMQLAKESKSSREANNQIIRYVLEAQRIKLNIPLVRQFVPGNDQQVRKLDLKSVSAEKAAKERKAKKHAGSANGDVHKHTNGHTNGHANGHVVGDETEIKKGDLFLLEVNKAMNDPDFIKEPEKIKLDRKTPYLLYNPTAHGHFNARQLTIYAVAGMIKHLATLDELREAHDLMGRIKTAKIPPQNRGAEDDYRERFVSVKWDELGTFPTTWNLRFNLVTGQTPHLASPKDNSLQGHGIDQLAGDQTKSSQDQFSGY